MLLIDAAELTTTTRRVFAAAGSAESEAEIIADHLVEANLKGHDSHGVGMIPSYLRNLGGGKVKPNEPGRIVSDTGSLIVYDGERGYGQIVARAATELAIERAKANGVAVVALRNAHHIGRVGTYGELCAAAGLVSLHFVNITDQRPAVAPWRGSDGMLMLVIDPSRLVGRAWMLDEIAAMSGYITASPPARPDEPVLIPGDPERANRARRLREGVPIDEETWREIAAAARGINVLIEAPQKSA